MWWWVTGLLQASWDKAVASPVRLVLLQIFSERLLTVRSEMQVKDLAMPRGASRAGQSIDSDVMTKENAVLCQAIEDTFLAVDEQIQTPESRQALVKIFQDVGRKSIHRASPVASPLWHRLLPRVDQTLLV